MNKGRSIAIRVCSRVAGIIRAWTIGLIVIWMSSAGPAWGQSAVWLPQGATTGNIYYNGGNVGIGTESPQDRLDVASGAIRVRGSATVGLPNTAVLDYYNANLRLISAGPNATTKAGMQFILANSDSSSIVVPLQLSPDGSVGIGTTNPGPYKLAVEGAIGARDVTITNASWSDYVFRPGYRLRPLSEVNTYIQAHHHLPEIPTEAEVEEKGVSVGQIQAKLLAKVEELTLHMIQADERNNRLEKQNQELRDRMAKLEAGSTR